MTEVKWIKIVTDIFDDEKIRLIESMPEADSIIVIWFKLLCLAGKQNNNGVFMLNDKIAYTDEMLAAIFQRPLNIVRLALKTFESFNMIEIVNNAITIPHWEKHQNIDALEQAREKNRKRVAAYREKQKLLANGCNVTVIKCNAVEEEKEDIERDGDIERMNENKKIYNIMNDRDELPSYESVMDDMCLESEVKPMMWAFIKHCQLNGKTLTNDKLTSILFEMDKQKLNPPEKIEALRTAINSGYYDIKRN